ncbi:MAG: peptidylprolyl isomerase [Porticoccaceae bacterium]|nr:peptidylprolyl isomerase [Porticoccaceae bacterium]
MAAAEQDPTMKVNVHHIISLHYTLVGSNNELISTTYGTSEPMVYLHGSGQMVKGFEQAVANAEIGQKLSLSLMPSQAYGLRNINKIQRIPTKYLRHEGTLVVGKKIHVNTDNGVKPGTVVKCGKFNVDVDLNHALAGKKLTFCVEIVAIRKATAKEIADGYMHKNLDGGN